MTMRMLPSTSAKTTNIINDRTYTAARPTDALFAGACYTDTTLGCVVVYDGASWRNPVSGAAV